MEMRLALLRFEWMRNLLRLLFASFLFITTITPSWALAQTSDDPWAAPLNLSRSGIAVKPSIVVDSTGVVHAVWQDDLEKYVYTRFDEGQWSTPKTTDWDLVFGWSPPLTTETQVSIYAGPNPLFVAGPGRYIFAFWVSPQGGLFTSRVENQDMGETSWEYARLIASGVGSFAVAFDARGNWHLAYLSRVHDRTHPIGIYYTRSKNAGGSWAPPVLLYESYYFRALGEGEGNLSVATVDTEEEPRVYVAWGIRPRRQVFLTQSADGGGTWEQPRLVAGPDPGSILAAPFNIHVGANEGSVVLVWQSGQAEGSCSQIYQSSKDAGVTWTDPELMSDEDMLGCAHSIEFVTEVANNTEGPLYLLTESQGQVSLAAWNGSQWSQPQVQSILSGFEEPEIYSEVILGCHQASLFGERLYVVGCDEGGGGDVWVTSRNMDSDVSGSQALVWSQLSPITDEILEMEDIELLSTDDGLIHAFFSKHQDSAIYYTHWNGESWSRIAPVLNLPDGEAGSPKIAAGPGNELFLIARNNRGSLYYSRAISGNAATESRWSPPTRLEIKHDGEIGSADVAWDAAGTLYLGYSVPVNDERGIFFLVSKDKGTTWSAPLQVFDGAAAGFDFIGAPSLLISGQGSLHITWNVQSIQGDGVPQPLSLFYTQSEDGGHTFNSEEPVVEEPVNWREIVADDNGDLHLLWQPQETKTIVWDQVSVDGGRSWQFPKGLPTEGMSPAIVVDPIGRLHLLDAGLGSLVHWLWDGSRWQSETPLSLPLSSQQESPIQLLAASVNKQGKMMVIMAKPTGEGDVAEMSLLYSTRTLELHLNQAPTEVALTETLVTPTIAITTSTPKPLLTPTATLDNQSANQSQVDRVETSDSVSPYIMALLPVALLLLVVVGIVIRRGTQVEDR